MSNIVFACTGNKRHPVTMKASNFSRKGWKKELKLNQCRYPVFDLYAGAYWNEVMRIYKTYPEHNYSVLSAGLGIKKFESLQPSYDASFSKRSLNPVPIDWVKCKPMKGIISTSNEYATVATSLGITLLKPSGRRWLPYLGGTGFTLAPRLIELWIKGIDLKALYETLPEPAVQPIPKRRQSITDKEAISYYTLGISPTKLRARINKAGFALSVERAFSLIRNLP